jgi:hypothetical protein
MRNHIIEQILPRLDDRGIIDLDKNIAWYADKSGTMHVSPSSHYYETSEISGVTSIAGMIASGASMCTDLYCITDGLGADREVVRVSISVDSVPEHIASQIEKLENPNFSDAIVTLRKLVVNDDIRYRLGNLRTIALRHGAQFADLTGLADVIASLQSFDARTEVTLEQAFDAISRIAATEALTTAANWFGGEVPGGELVHFRVRNTNDRYSIDCVATWVRHRLTKAFLGGATLEQAKRITFEALDRMEVAPRYTNGPEYSRDEILVMSKTYIEKMCGFLATELADDAPWLLPTWRVDDQGRGGMYETFCNRANIYKPGYRGTVCVPHHVYKYLVRHLERGRFQTGAPAPEGLTIAVLETAFSFMETEPRDSDLYTFPGAIAVAAKL